MLRIGIVGSDNSHALVDARLANIDGVVGDHRVTMITGDDPTRTEEVAGEGRIDRIVPSVSDMIGEIDAAIVVHRHGALHARHAIPLLEAGIPTFVDKPMALTIEECQKMFDAAERGGTIVSSYSNLRYAPSLQPLKDRLPEIGSPLLGQFSGPCDFSSEYGGAFFYATHTAEICFALMGIDIDTVRAWDHGRHVTVHLTYANGAIATLSLIRDGMYHFTALVAGPDGIASGEIFAGDDAYAAALRVVFDSAERGESPLDRETMLAPIRFVLAMNASLAHEGATVDFSTGMPM